MNFNEALSRLKILSEKLKKKQISQDVFAAEVNKLQVLDDMGTQQGKRCAKLSIASDAPTGEPPVSSM